MTNKLGNRVKMTVSGAPGTGTITLGLATSGFQSLDAAGILNGDTIPYVIEDGTNWEVGVGTYSATGPSLARTTVTESSVGGAKISATADAIVMLSPLAADMQSGTSANQVVRLDGSAKLPAVDGSALTALNASNIASGTIGGARLPTPTTTVLGGVKSATAATHQFQTGVDTMGAPTFAQPAAGDVTGLAASATTDTTNASNISSGTLGGARLPTPTTSVLGGVKSATAPSNQFQTGIDTTGAPTFAQPSASNITGLAASATTDTTNASNISTGTLAGARLPTPTTTALGGVKSATAGANQFQTGIDTSGIPTFAQPSASNISGLGTAATLDVGTTANKIVQLDGSAKLPAIDGSQLTNLLAVTITNATGAANLPTGTTGQRPTGSSGQLRYNSTTGKFEGYGAAWGNIGGGAAISDAAPSNPGAGDLWWNSADGILYVYYSDGSSSQWVGASSGGMGQYLPLTGGSINGSLTISSPLGVASGGTGLNSLTAGYIPYGNETGAFSSGALIVNSGNLGIGTTPSAWDQYARAIQFGTSGTIASQYAIGIANNAYYNGTNWIRIGAAATALYNVFSGTHNWYVAGTGTAGSTVSYTTAMTLDASGNFTNTGYHTINSQATNVTPGSGWGGQLNVTGSGYTGGISLDATGMWIGHNSAARAIIFATSYSEKARISSDGNFLVGTTTSRAAITLNYGAEGAYSGSGIITDPASYTGIRLYQSTSGNLTLFNVRANDTFGNIALETSIGEVARVTRNGNLLVGGGINVTTGNKCLVLFGGTAPTAVAAGSIALYATTRATGNLAIGLYTEGTPVVASTTNTVTNKVAIRINGTLYYLLASTSAT